MRRFHLHRLQDVSGVSGVGIVAEGCVFTDGTVALRWTSATPSTTLHATMENLEKVHCHHGQTQVIWKDT